MTKLIRRSVFVTVLVVTASVTLVAADRATPAEAKAMLAKAVAHYKSVGRTQALADFTAKKPPFIDRDLYVVCIGPKGIVTAHGGSATYVGATADILKDAEGKPVGTTIWNVGSSKGTGFIEYPMTSPISKTTERKSTFFEKFGDDVCAVGAYKAL